MKNIKKGNIVGRKSHNKDVIFVVKRIINTPQGKTAILRGLIDRVEADSDIKDLEIIDRYEIKKRLNMLEEKVKRRVEQSLRDEKEYKIGLLTKNLRAKEKIVIGKILHLDGDRKYSEKSYKYYKKLGLNAIVRNIPEYRQPRVVYSLLKTYNPDILVITGHHRRY